MRHSTEPQNVIGVMPPKASFTHDGAVGNVGGRQGAAVREITPGGRDGTDEAGVTAEQAARRSQACESADSGTPATKALVTPFVKPTARDVRAPTHRGAAKIVTATWPYCSSSRAANVAAVRWRPWAARREMGGSDGARPVAGGPDATAVDQRTSCRRGARDRLEEGSARKWATWSAYSRRARAGPRSTGTCGQAF